MHLDRYYDDNDDDDIQSTTQIHITFMSIQFNKTIKYYSA